MNSRPNPSPIPPLGLGIGWRPEIALAIERRSDLGFVEVVAENLLVDGDADAENASSTDPSLIAVGGSPRIRDRDPRASAHGYQRGRTCAIKWIKPPAIDLLRSRRVQVIPHGISLSLGGAERPHPNRLRHLANLATYYDSPVVSEHIAFVRAGGVEAGHLLPLPRTRAALNVLIENVRIAMEALPVPLALENISTLFDWPNAELDEADFLRDLLEKTGALLLLDLSNVYANTHNLGGDPVNFLSRLPLDCVAYVHIGGGIERDGIYHDTHAHRTPPQALELLRELTSRAAVPGAMLERDDHFPAYAELNRELDAIRGALFGQVLQTDSDDVR